MEWLKEEATAAYGLVVVFGVLFAGAIIGQFFGGIGDKLFGGIGDKLFGKNDKEKD